MKILLALGVLLFAASFSVASGGELPHVVMLIAEREYETETTLSEFARQQLQGDYRTTIIQASPEDPNRLEGIEAIADADVLLISVRRRALPREQLELVRQYVSAGKPVIGIRTASHAFSLRGGQPPAGHAVWPSWDREVFGGNYTNHYGNRLKATVTIEPDPGAAEALLRGIERQPFAAGGSLYKVSPLADGAQVLMRGRVEGSEPEPVAWTFVRANGGKSFYTSLGHVDDFRGGVLPSLLRRAIGWALR